MLFIKSSRGRLPSLPSSPHSPLTTHHSQLFLILPLLLFLLFFYLPVFTIILNAFIHDGKFSFQSLTKLLHNSYHLKVIIFTLKQAFLSALLSMLIGFPAGYFLFRYDFPGKKLFQAISFIPFTLPGIIVALGFILFWGNNGYLNKLLQPWGFHINILYSFQAIIIAHAYYNFPVIMKIIGDAFENLNPNLLYASQSLGLNKIQTFFKTVLPALLPAIFNSFTLVFIYCFMSFSLVLILGDIKYSTIEVSIYMLVRTYLDLNSGMALGFIQLLFSVFFIYLTSVNSQSLNFNLNYYTHSPKKLFTFDRSIFSKIPILLFFLSIILFLICPLGSIVFYYFQKLGLANLTTMFHSFANNTYDPILGFSQLKVVSNSLFIAVSSSVIAFTVTVLFAWFFKNKPFTKTWDLLLTLPMGISVISFSLGMLKLNYLFQLNEYLLIIICHTIFIIPFSYKIVFPSLRNFNKNLIYSALTLGKTPVQAFFGIVLPNIKKDIILALSFGFSISLGELAIVSMLQRDVVTLPLSIYRYISARDFTQATFMSILLITVSFIIFLTSGLLNKKSPSQSD